MLPTVQDSGDGALLEKSNEIFGASFWRV